MLASQWIVSIAFKFTIGFVASVTIIGGCSDHHKTVKGDGVMKVEARPVTTYSKVKAHGAFAIQWVPGTAALEVSGDQNILPLIQTTVSGDTLEIKAAGNFSTGHTTTLKLSSNSLDHVELMGGNSFDAKNLSVETLTIKASGASSIHLSGNVAKLDAELEGASSLSARSLPTQNTNISLNGASSADIDVTNALKASISGAGSLTYSGNPAKVEKHVNGAGSIRQRK